MRTLKQINADIRALRQEMRAAGVKRLSCFNGGLGPLEYRFNAAMFRLETERMAATAAETKGKTENEN